MLGGHGWQRAVFEQITSNKKLKRS